ncbi:hypothetical protein OSB04_001983 [Centaurea solstitialis]|uniref:Uncharacterized protein n=1 Tax=Centaurea solstitialis TaxID=347529 RepID=A0AA38WMA5_9ASTR|nr:hypothetical protein OSB04_001983 [Centaurea solstitialis]
MKQGGGMVVLERERGVMGSYTVDVVKRGRGRRVGKLNRLCLRGCCVTGYGLSNLLERLPHLETLEVSNINIRARDIKVIGRNCPHLKSFTIKTKYADGHVHPRTIASSMPHYAI